MDESHVSMARARSMVMLSGVKTNNGVWYPWGTIPYEDSIFRPSSEGILKNTGKLSTSHSTVGRYLAE